jgi:hypothetical protein
VSQPVTDCGLRASPKMAKRGWSWAGMPRAGWASVACNCWFIAHRAQGRRRVIVSVPLHAAQANSGG